MKNNPLYIQLKQIAFDGGYTVEQAGNATPQQAADLLDIPKARLPHFPNMKALLIRELQERTDEVVFQSIKDTIKTWLQANHPGYEIDKGKEDGKRFVTIWFDGKPEYM